MKSALIDASSAILLYKAGLIDGVASIYEVSMAPAVFSEVTVIGHAGDAYFSRACRKGAIHIAPAPAETRLGAGPAGLGAGERETIGIYALGGADFIILDDGKGARYCRSRTIPYINALLCTKILYWTGCLDRLGQDQAFERLLSLGRYSRTVAELAGRCSRRELDRFMPGSVMDAERHS